VLELLGVVPLLCAIPTLFHQLANSTLLHTPALSAVNITLGASELLPAMAILPFMLYQLAGFGTLHYLVSKPVNWAINLGILGLIIGTVVANRQAAFGVEKSLGSILILGMAATVLYGVLKLRKMQTDYDLRCPTKESKKSDQSDL
jgi:hypothetical protein